MGDLADNWNGGESRQMRDYPSSGGSPDSPCSPLSAVRSVLEDSLKDWISLNRAEQVSAHKTALSRLELAEHEMLMLAKLGSEDAKFFNPLHAGMAKIIRDRILSANS